MTVEEFDKLMKEEVDPKCSNIMGSKGLAYSGKEDKFGNFKRCAKLAGLEPQKVLYIYLLKHQDALASFMRGEYLDSEPIEGRIFDIINYMKLLYGLLKEEGRIK